MVFVENGIDRLFVICSGKICCIVTGRVAVKTGVERSWTYIQKRRGIQISLKIRVNEFLD